MNAVEIWTVYERPLDYPQGYIARRWLNDVSTTDVVTGASLDEVRDKLPPGLHLIPRHPKDDACIVETWL